MDGNWGGRRQFAQAVSAAAPHHRQSSPQHSMPIDPIAGERFSPIRFSLTDADSNLGLLAEKHVRRAANRKTLFIIASYFGPTSVRSRWSLAVRCRPTPALIQSGGLPHPLAEAPRRCTDFAVKDHREMALVGEPDLSGDQRERQGCPAQQSFRALKPSLGDISLRSDSGRPLKRAAEMIRAQTRNVRQGSKREFAVKIGFDIIQYALQTLPRKTHAGG